ncbi:MAG TPA: hypothetical protein VMF31_12530 [Solirubrobacterales bacterium]|nr:hypothetical protein [Solirubrobacterales bacterium]
MEKTKNITVAKVAISDRTPKLVAAAVLSGSLLLGADNVLTVTLTAATLAVAEVTRARFGVRSLRTSVTRSANSQLESVAGHTP